jgi:hypothetical protein
LGERTAGHERRADLGCRASYSVIRIPLHSDLPDPGPHHLEQLINHDKSRRKNQVLPRQQSERRTVKTHEFAVAHDSFVLAPTKGLCSFYQLSSCAKPKKQIIIDNKDWKLFLSGAV